MIRCIASLIDADLGGASVSDTIASRISGRRSSTQPLGEREVGELHVRRAALEEVVRLPRQQHPGRTGRGLREQPGAVPGWRP